MANQRYVYELTTGKSMDGMVLRVQAFLQNEEKMNCQNILCDNPDYIILQARVKKGEIKQLIGMDKALTVRFMHLGDNKVSIEIGEAKWADKGVVMAVSMFILWPLAITATAGIYQQKKLPQKIIRVVDKYLGKEEDTYLIEDDKKENDILDSMTVEKLVVNSQKILPRILGKLIR